MTLYARHQRRLYLFILALICDPVDAEDLLQETNLILWRKFDQWQRGTNFYAWAAQVAYYEVLKYRERLSNRSTLLDTHVIEKLAEEAVELNDTLDRRRQALNWCLTKLRTNDRHLIQQRYAPGASGKSLAAVLGRPANSVYKSLGRIRRSLYECVNRRLALESAEGDLR